MILPPLTPIILATQMIVTIADEIPYFDAAAICRAATAEIPAIVPLCIQDEQRAHDRLVQEWSQFVISDKVGCTRATESGSSSGYVKLLSCLELAREARKAGK
jgi:hypothetical protein